MNPRLPVGLLLLAPLAALADDGLGRLFHTPGERALLDASREHRAAPAAATGADVPEPPEAAAGAGSAVPAGDGREQAPVAVDGLVLRRRGPSTAWIDGSPATRAELAAGGSRDVRIGRGEVEVDAGGDLRARVRPGQVFDPTLGRVIERFERDEGPAGGASPAP